MNGTLDRLKGLTHVHRTVLAIFLITVVSPSATCAGLTISGATITLANNTNLTTTGDINLNNGGLVANQSNITLGGNWTATSGTFTAGTSSVAFNGSAAQTMSNGNQSFWVIIDSNTSNGGLTFGSSFSAAQLTVNGAALGSATTVYFNAGSTATITTFNLTGSASKLVNVRSTIPGSYAYLNNTTANNVSFTDAQDNNASPGITIVAGTTSNDSGNNINWTFGTLSVSYSKHAYNFGTVSLAATTVSTSAIVVNNSGTVTETYSLSVSTTGAQTVWGVGTTPPASNNTFVLFGTFNATQPAAGSFGNEDVIISTPTKATSTIYSIGGQTGVSTASGSTRNLWFRLDMPLTSTTPNQQQMNVTINASTP